MPEPEPGDAPGVLVVAHRLPRGPAISRLPSLGASAVELDLVLVDGEVLVSHQLAVHPRTQWLRRDQWRFTVSRVPRGPRLAQVLPALPDGLAVTLDLKESPGYRAEDLADAAAGVVRETGALDRVLGVSGLHWPALDRLRDEGLPVWPTVAGPQALAVVETHRRPDGQAGLSVRHTLLTPPVLARLLPFGRVVAWPVNHPGRARALVAAGAGGVTTDRPAVMLSLAGAI